MTSPIAFIPPLGPDGQSGPLYTIDEDGSNAVQLKPDLWAGLACGASKLASSVADTIFSPRHLEVMNRDGSAMAEVTNVPSSVEVSFGVPFDFSPNNKQLAMVYNEDESTPGALEGIVIVNVDNTGYRKIPLGSSEAAEQYTHIDGQIQGGVRWSPNGHRYVYCAQFRAIPPQRLEIRYCDPSGGGVTVLASGPEGTDWFLMDLFNDNKHVLAKHYDRSTHRVSVHKLGYDGSDETLFTDPTGSIYAGSLVDRDIVLSPSNEDALLATSTGLARLSLSDGSLTSIYSGLQVYRVSWDPPLLVVGSMKTGPGAVGHVRLG